MSRYRIAGMACCVVLGLLAGVAQAVPFDSQFKIVKIHNECTVALPGAADFQPAADGQAYPYGTRIKTGRNSSAVISFSEGNECRVQARTDITVTQDVKDSKLKTLKLAAGKAEVSLEPAFHKNNSLRVETPTAICGAVECHFNAEVTTGIGGLVNSIFSSIKGIIRVDGAGFSVPVMSDGASLRVSGNPALTQMEVRVLQGVLKVQVTGKDGQPQVLELGPGSRIHIGRTTMPDGRTEKVTVRVVKADGTHESFTYTQPVTTTATTTTTTSTSVATSTTTSTTMTSVTTAQPLPPEEPRPEPETPTPVGQTL